MSSNVPKYDGDVLELLTADELAAIAAKAVVSDLIGEENVIGKILRAYEALQTVVEKLPKDAEGAPLTKGSTRYIRRTAGNGSFPVEVVGLDVRVRYPDGHISRENPERLHSTREADGMKG